MKPYPKINSLFKRATEGPNRGAFIPEWSQPEFELLWSVPWVATEKIDGTNIRVHWDGEKRTIGGRTDRAQIPADLIERLDEILPEDALRAEFDTREVTLYGEGFGGRIQKAGPLYGDTDFILFDIRAGNYWLMREGIRSSFGAEKEIQAEGVVAVPAVELQDRAGNRIITKIKTKDFRRGSSVNYLFNEVLA